MDASSLTSRSSLEMAMRRLLSLIAGAKVMSASASAASCVWANLSLQVAAVVSSLIISQYYIL